MLKYVDTKVVFREVPGEITLAINISNCPNRCINCHSKYLWEDVGEPLNFTIIEELIHKNKGITCVCFMGGDQSPQEIFSLCKKVKAMYPQIKTAWYSGMDTLPYCISSDLHLLDYIKVGPYIEEMGGLDNPNTNQRFYKVKDSVLINITKKFWNKNHEN